MTDTGTVTVRRSADNDIGERELYVSIGDVNLTGRVEKIAL